MTPGEAENAELICEKGEITDHLNELEAKPKGDTVTLGSLHTMGNGVSTGHPLFWRKVERESAGFSPHPRG